jgi:hypothetical protein
MQKIETLIGMNPAALATWTLAPGNVIVYHKPLKRTYTISFTTAG